MHKHGDEPSASLTKSFSRVVAIFMVALSLGQEAMDILLGVALAYTIGISQIVKDAERKREGIGAVVLFASYVLALAFRFVGGLLVFWISFEIIRSAETVVDILKDCVAIAFIVEVDSLVLVAMKKGLFTSAMTKSTDAEFVVYVRRIHAGNIRLIIENGGVVLVGGLTLMVTFAMVADELDEDKTKTLFYRFTTGMCRSGCSFSPQGCAV